MSRKGKKKETLRRKVAEKAVSAPKELARRGLNDGTERIRAQFRNNRGQERPEDYGSEKIEGGVQRGAALAQNGAALAQRSVEVFLNKKKQEKENEGQYEATKDSPVPNASERTIHSADPQFSEPTATVWEDTQPFGNLDRDMGASTHGGTKGTQVPSAPRETHPAQSWQRQSELVIENNAPQISDRQHTSWMSNQSRKADSIRAVPDYPQGYVKEKTAEARIPQERNSGRLIREKAAVSGEARVVKERGTPPKPEAAIAEHPAFRPADGKEAAAHTIAERSDHDRPRNRPLDKGMPDDHRIERAEMTKARESVSLQQKRGWEQSEPIRTRNLHLLLDGDDNKLRGESSAPNQNIRMNFADPQTEELPLPIREKLDVKAEMPPVREKPESLRVAVYRGETNDPVIREKTTGADVSNELPRQKSEAPSQSIITEKAPIREKEISPDSITPASAQALDTSDLIQKKNGIREIAPSKKVVRSENNPTGQADILVVKERHAAKMPVPLNTPKEKKATDSPVLPYESKSQKERGKPARSNPQSKDAMPREKETPIRENNPSVSKSGNSVRPYRADEYIGMTPNVEKSEAVSLLLKNEMPVRESKITVREKDKMPGALSEKAPPQNGDRSSFGQAPAVRGNGNASIHSRSTKSAQSIPPQETDQTVKMCPAVQSAEYPPTPLKKNEVALREREMAIREKNAIPDVPTEKSPPQMSARQNVGQFPAVHGKQNDIRAVSVSKPEKPVRSYSADERLGRTPDVGKSEDASLPLRNNAQIRESGLTIREKNTVPDVSAEKTPPGVDGAQSGDQLSAAHEKKCGIRPAPASNSRKITPAYEADITDISLSEQGQAVPSEKPLPKIKERQDSKRMPVIREKNSFSLNGCVPAGKDSMPPSTPDQPYKSATASGSAREAISPLLADRETVYCDPLTANVADMPKTPETSDPLRSPGNIWPRHDFGAKQMEKEISEPPHKREALRSGGLPKGSSPARKRIKEGKASIKTSALTAKQPVKALERAQNKAARDARHTTSATKAMARNGKKASRVASQVTRNTVRAVRNTAHAVWRMLKLSRRAIEAIASTIASGGSTLLIVVIVVVLVICMVALLMVTPYGIFLSSEYSDSGQTLQIAITSINGEFSLEIEQIQANNSHDILDLDNDGVSAVINNWNDVLAVYAVKITTDSTTPGDAATMTPEKMSVLRRIFWDMTQISYSLETRSNTDTGEDQTVLTVAVTTKSKDEIAEEYGFTPEQLALLDELSQSEYAGLFTALSGSDKNLMLSSAQIQQLAEQLADVSAQRQQVVMTAYQLLGKVNYFWGGKSLVLGWDTRWGKPAVVTAAGSSTTGSTRPYGLDCSGFVDWVFYNATGGAYIIGHGGGASAQHSWCDTITWAQAKPGDLAFFPGDSHVGIVCGVDESGNIQIIHCGYSSNNVVVTGRNVGFTSVGRPKLYSE